MAKKLTGLPESVPIGPIDFDVVAMPDRAQVSGEESWGNIDYEDVSIEIWAELSQYHQVQTLFHEVIHGAMDRSGLCHRLTDEEQEQLCTLFGYVFADLWKCGWLTFADADVKPPRKPAPSSAQTPPP